jgi:integrase
MADLNRIEIKVSKNKLKGQVPVRKRLSPAPAPESIKSIKSAFRSACKRAGIVDFKFHDLRHTFASQMVMKGASLKEVQEILGHKTMTMRYAHLSQEHKKKAVNLLNGLTASKSLSAELTCHKPVTIPKSSVSTIG